MAEVNITFFVFGCQTNFSSPSPLPPGDNVVNGIDGLCVMLNLFQHLPLVTRFRKGGNGDLGIILCAIKK